MLAGIDGNSAPCLLLDPITARQFIDRGGFDSKEKLIRWVHETAQMPAGRYWDLAKDDELINHFPEADINVVVVGGETNGYWRIMGAKYRKTVSVDDWR
jgi:hypothetical protein